MGSYVYKGKTTLRRYEWMTAVLPSALLNVYGQPVQSGTFNGEILVLANHDGSVMMPQATGPPVGASTTVLPYGTNDNDIYSAYVQPSPWTEVP
jgi:hypothetical protein